MLGHREARDAEESRAVTGRAEAQNQAPEGGLCRDLSIPKGPLNNIVCVFVHSRPYGVGPSTGCSKNLRPARAAAFPALVGSPVEGGSSPGLQGLCLGDRKSGWIFTHFSASLPPISPRSSDHSQEVHGGVWLFLRTLALFQERKKKNK